MSVTDSGLLGMGQAPPPPPPPPPPPWPMMWPPYQPTVYIQREDYTHQVEAPCKWYEDLESAGDTVYCRAPAMWVVLAAVGAGALFMMSRKR